MKRSRLGPNPTPARLLAALALTSCAALAQQVCRPGPDDVAGCYPDTLTPAQMAEAMTRWGLLPPAMFFGGADFFLDSEAWIGDGGLTDNGAAQRANLTYSIVPDNTTWGSLAYVQGPSDLRAALTGAFGPGNEDLGLEFARQGIAAYRVAGLTFREVGDDGAQWGTPDAPEAPRGFIRIGGFSAGIVLLGYSSYPAGGGDMYINTGIFTTGNLGSNALDYRYLRNTIAHEMGHALGLAHSVPCNNTKLMEPVLNVSVDALSLDDVRGAERNYGDRFAGDTGPANAPDLGDLAVPAPRSVRFENLSTNGSGQTFTLADRDWLRFRISTAQTIHLGVDPKGGVYAGARQDQNCEPASPPMIDAQHAGVLVLELRSFEGFTVIASASAAPGLPIRLDRPLTPGEYTIRVIDTGPNLAANQRLQLYDFFAAAGNSLNLAPPQVIAGVGKRIKAGARCCFLGDINTHAFGAAWLIDSGFEWDLDGDGTFETIGAPRPARVYYSNGTYPVTLRVTDSNGSSATDTIPVVVFGATTSVTVVVPSSIPRWFSTPVTIFGANLKNVESASEFTVSGSGVSVIGTPTANADGTAIFGLSLLVSPGATMGHRTITVSNADGTGAGINAINITEADPCTGDANGDRVINAADVSGTLGQFGQSGNGLSSDFNHDGKVDFFDLNTVLSNFGRHC